MGWDSHAPTDWLARDLAAARARGAAHSFVFGHKPAYTYKYDDKVTAGGFGTDPDTQKAFWTIIETYGATYFSGHEHICHAEQPTKAQGGKAWQVIVGSGGSPFEAKPGDSQNPQGRMYAWVTVKVMKSGQVHMDAYGFDENYGPTRKLTGWDR